ncbi:MAG: CHAD domain-containing protein [Rhizobiales bacterium]|nr:CHAD domain-containing protein [Hyphomicrobiales bacterium]
MASIRAGHPPGEAFRVLARKTLTAAAKDLKAVGVGGSVHLARKRLKFMRSLLRFIRHALGRRNFKTANSRLRSAAAVLAAARRAEALQQAVVRLQADQEVLLPELAELASIAIQVHGERATPAALQVATAEARRIVATVRGDVAHWPLAKRDMGLFLRGLTDAYGRARRKLLEGLSSGGIATLHEARKSVIHHLHQLEMLKPLWPGMIRMWAGELLKLREALGDLNDLDELEALAIGQGPRFSSDAARDHVLQAIAARRANLVNRVRGQADHLFAEKPKAFARRIGAMWQVMLA